MVLTYSNGDGPCPNGANRKTVMTFVCDVNAKSPQITFGGENPMCTYNINIRSSEACPRSVAPQIETCPINVFLMPHTHDDVGWLNTIDVCPFAPLN